jgi:hypothetical protein
MLCRLYGFRTSVVDPHHGSADPDSTYHPDANPDPAFFFNADPDLVKLSVTKS